MKKIFFWIIGISATGIVVYLAYKYLVKPSISSISDTSTTAVTPTNTDYILMGDHELSWDRLYVLGTNLGFSKTKVEEIVRSGRASFDTTIAAKYPNWIQLLKDICAKYGIIVKATPGFTGK